MGYKEVTQLHTLHESNNMHTDQSPTDFEKSAMISHFIIICIYYLCSNLWTEEVTVKSVFYVPNIL